MKKLSIVFLLIVSFLISNSQPQSINYQGVARDSQGRPLLNQNIGIRISVLDSSVIGQPVYVEIHNTTTSGSGLFNLGIGLGTVRSGAFSTIPWGQGEKWLKIEMDSSGGNNFQLIGTTQFLSVPYALHAQTANMISPNSSSQSTFSSFSQKSPNAMLYFYAVDYCGSLIESGFSDWRLPTIIEFQNYIEINGLSSLPSTFYTPNQSVWFKEQSFSSNNGSLNGLYYSSVYGFYPVTTGSPNYFYVFCIR